VLRGPDLAAQPQHIGQAQAKQGGAAASAQLTELIQRGLLTTPRRSVPLPLVANMI
jgi:hypothetical protein